MPVGSSEPVVATWVEVDAATILQSLVAPEPGRPVVMAVDGRSGAGKSTLTRQLANAVPDSAVVATDDLAWHYSIFDWTEQLISHVVDPVRRGEPVTYRPPGWVERRRPGAVTVAAARSVLFVEGVGASQRGLVAAVDVAIWVQSDLDTARALGIERDIASGVNGDRVAAVAFWNEWAAVEEPFLEADAPWSRAAVVLAGVPLASSDRLYRSARDGARE